MAANTAGRAASGSCFVFLVMADQSAVDGMRSVMSATSQR